MDEGIVERGVDVGNTENELALSNLGTERDGVFLSGSFGLLGGLLHPDVSIFIHHNSVSLRARNRTTRIQHSSRTAYVPCRWMWIVLRRVSVVGDGLEDDLHQLSIGSH